MPKLARSYDANYPEYHASFQYSREVYYGSSSVGHKIHYRNLRDENRPKRKTSKKKNLFQFVVSCSILLFMLFYGHPSFT